MSKALDELSCRREKARTRGPRLAGQRCRMPPDRFVPSGTPAIMDTRNPAAWPEAADPASHDLEEELRRLFARVKFLEGRGQKSERRRRALIHILSDLKESNRRLSEQRTAMLHLLSDHEQDRKRLASQAVRLDNSRRALLHML